MDTLFPMGNFGKGKREKNSRRKKNYKKQYIAGTSLPQIEWSADYRLNRTPTKKEANKVFENKLKIQNKDIKKKILNFIKEGRVKVIGFKPKEELNEKEIIRKMEDTNIEVQPKIITKLKDKKEEINEKLTQYMKIDINEDKKKLKNKIENNKEELIEKLKQLNVDVKTRNWEKRTSNNKYKMGNYNKENEFAEQLWVDINKRTDNRVDKLINPSSEHINEQKEYYSKTLKQDKEQLKELFKEQGEFLKDKIIDYKEDLIDAEKQYKLINKDGTLTKFKTNKVKNEERLNRFTDNISTKGKNILKSIERWANKDVPEEKKKIEKLITSNYRGKRMEIPLEKASTMQTAFNRIILHQNELKIEKANEAVKLRMEAKELRKQGLIDQADEAELQAKLAENESYNLLGKSDAIKRASQTLHQDRLDAEVHNRLIEQNKQEEKQYKPVTMKNWKTPKETKMSLGLL